MNNAPRITRRAALVGAAVSTAALAVPAMAASRPSTIEAAAERFREDAMALDPSIKGCWVGFDEVMDGPRENRVMSVWLERDTNPMVRPKRATVSPLVGLIATHKAAVRKHAALARLDGEQCAVNQGQSLPGMLEKLTAACDAEEAARLELVLYRPRTTWEAQRKARYIKRSMPFREGWCGDDGFVSALIAQLGKVA